MFDLIPTAATYLFPLKLIKNEVNITNSYNQKYYLKGTPVVSSLDWSWCSNRNFGRKSKSCYNMFISCQKFMKIVNYLSRNSF